jgi:hypothetical protein
MRPIGWEPCPKCGPVQTRILWTARTALKIAANVVLVPFWVIAGGAGTERTPLIPVERECLKCGERFRPRPPLSELAGPRGRGAVKHE